MKKQKLLQRTFRLSLSELEALEEIAQNECISSNMMLRKILNQGLTEYAISNTEMIDRGNLKQHQASDTKTIMAIRNMHLLETLIKKIVPKVADDVISEATNLTNKTISSSAMSAEDF